MKTHIRLSDLLRLIALVAILAIVFAIPLSASAARYEDFTVGRITINGTLITNTPTRLNSAVPSGSDPAPATSTITSLVNGGGTNGPAVASFPRITAAAVVFGTNAPASTNAAIWVGVTYSNRPHALMLIPLNQ